MMPGQDLKYDFARAEMAQFVPVAARRLLDVGCGSGAFGSTLRRVRPSIDVMWAIEPDPVAAEAATAHFDHVDVGLFPSALQADAGKFDCIVFNDVLEHMEDPEAALNASKSLLVPGGCVVASIPNVRHVKVLSPLVFKGEFTYTERGILDRTHLRFFTSKSISRLFTDAGYEISTMAGINMGRRYRLYNRLLLETVRNFLFEQYAVVARPYALG